MLVSFAAKLWMSLKRFRSRNKAKRVLRDSLPQLATVQEVAEYVTQKLTYTGDPVLGGLDDFYQHPEHLQYCINAKLTPPVDCDDYSVLAYALLKQIPDAKPQLIVLAIKLKTVLAMTLKSLAKFKVPYFPFHEGCLVEQGGVLWFIDTNGLWLLKTQQDLADRYGKAWGVEFIILPTEYPFN